MRFAFDCNDNRIYIDDTKSNQVYFCPYCGEQLITKKGEVRQHHFAHKANSNCTDTWQRQDSNGYDVSEWHNKWQSYFPQDNQEIKLTLGKTSHRADILTGNTVVEFQHSLLSANAFDNRNNFYFNLGYKVVWLFDLTGLYENYQIHENNSNPMTFCWNNPKKAFNSYDIQSGCIDLFFQLKSNEEKCIVRVINLSQDGFERFETSEWLSKKEFLSYLGLNNGECEKPDLLDLSVNEAYLSFCDKYDVHMNKQQERAIQAIEGSNLLLAVPGSGKTTVLVNRLGYMVFVKHINPSKILALTYNKAAQLEMERRYKEKFNVKSEAGITFKTINSLADSIYKEYCEAKHHKKRTLITNSEQRKILRGVMSTCCGEKHSSEEDIINLLSAISYIKNMRMSEDDIESDSVNPILRTLYCSYAEKLNERNLMDYDDQLCFAVWLLENKEEFARQLQNRYHYICVDEAQDTSRIQHDIIRHLATGNNIFMVGDEDQSIYGFRGAYPKALLNFRFEYKNPYILRMERNYRSTEQIVKAASTFIKQNTGRYEKNMVAERGDGEKVELIKVPAREDQYEHLLDIAVNRTGSTAFLYRDNDSAVALVDLLIQKNVPFKYTQPKKSFFEKRIVREILSYLKLTYNPYDIDSFKTICNTGIVYLKSKQIPFMEAAVENRNLTVYDALDEQMKYVKDRYKCRASQFRQFMEQLSIKSVAAGIKFICDKGYENFARQQKENTWDQSAVETLLVLAKNKNDFREYVSYLDILQKKCQNEFTTKGENPVVLSTIHSSKGLEYDTVCLVDVFDGRFPSEEADPIFRSKDNLNRYQEERRLFYVGITRAKNKLYLINIENKPSGFIDQIFGLDNKPSCYINQIYQPNSDQFIGLNGIFEDMQCMTVPVPDTEIKPIRKIDLSKEEKLRIGYEEICNLFNQQDSIIRDKFGQRWVRCEICNEIKSDSAFTTYGGDKKINIGICKKCYKEKDTRH